MTKPLFLVTGAAGGTGGYAVTELLKGVRALVRKEDNRAEHLRRIGADVVVANLLDLDAVRDALDGVQAAYFVYPIRPGLIDATVYFAQAAKEAAIGSVVNMSQISAQRGSKSNAARDHWVAERVWDWADVPVTHLRPTFFAQWLLYPRFNAPIRKQNVIMLPFGEGRHAPIAAEDIGRLVAEILLRPSPHIGKTYSLQGPVEMNYTEIASIMSEVLARTITYRPIGIDQFRKHLESTPNFPPFLLQHLCAAAAAYQDQNGLFTGTDEVIERVTGQAPLTERAFITLHKDAFIQEEQPSS